MIHLTINKEKVSIPTMNELTVKQYIELSKKDINIVSYLSVVLGMTYRESFNCKTKGIDKLLKRLGKLEDYTKITPEKKVIVNDELIDILEIEVSTVGQRFMIEESSRNMGNEELLCFILAIGMINDPEADDNPAMNFDKITELKDKLMDGPYKKILPNAFFLANRFLIGRNNAMNYLKMSKQLISMRVKGSRQALRNWLHTLTILKFKRYASY